MEYDLLNTPFEVEKRAHKLRRTIPTPNSYYLDVGCKTCKKTQRAFSHG